MKRRKFYEVRFCTAGDPTARVNVVNMQRFKFTTYRKACRFALKLHSILRLRGTPEEWQSGKIDPKYTLEIWAPTNWVVTRYSEMCAGEYCDY